MKSSRFVQIFVERGHGLVRSFMGPVHRPVKCIFITNFRNFLKVKFMGHFLYFWTNLAKMSFKTPVIESWMKKFSEKIPECTILPHPQISVSMIVLFTKFSKTVDFSVQKRSTLGLFCRDNLPPISLKDIYLYGT